METEKMRMSKLYKVVCLPHIGDRHEGIILHEEHAPLRVLSISFAQAHHYVLHMNVELEGEKWKLKISHVSDTKGGYQWSHEPLDFPLCGVFKMIFATFLRG